jgi:nucleotide-binding universal stress UspA family protein
MFNKILVPLDTSEYAEQVIPSVTELAESFNSEIDVISICEPDKIEETRACQRYIRAEAEKIKGRLTGAVKIKTETIFGSPGQKILQYAQDEHVDFIFMSSHGRSGVMLWPLGGTVNKVLHRVGVPLCIFRVKEDPEAAAKTRLFNHILVPLDGSERGAKVLPYIVEIAKKIKSEVVLFQVIETDRQIHSLGRIDNIPFREEQLDSFKKRAQDYLNQESARFAGSKAKVTTAVKTGNVAEEIIKYANEIDCSLIALSSHGHSGFESWVIGSVTNKILHSSRRSLLFVPALET